METLKAMEKKERENSYTKKDTEKNTKAKFMTVYEQTIKLQNALKKQ